MSDILYILTTFVNLKRKLLTSSLSVESISYSVGYKDSFVFAKAFKQITGMSPTMYRKEKKEAESKLNKEFMELMLV